MISRLQVIFFLIRSEDTTPVLYSGKNIRKGSTLDIETFGSFRTSSIDIPLR